MKKITKKPTTMNSAPYVPLNVEIESSKTPAIFLGLTMMLLFIVVLGLLIKMP